VIYKDKSLGLIVTRPISPIAFTSVAPSNPNDFLVELINVGLGQHMVLQTRQKSRAGVVQKAKDAVFLGGVAPLGYDVVEQKYVVN